MMVALYSGALCTSLVPVQAYLPRETLECIADFSNAIHLDDAVVVIKENLYGGIDFFHEKFLFFF